MNKPTLTIGIPTKNRHNLITVLLDDIFSQLTDEIRARVNVLISDNASDDTYDIIVKKYSMLHPNVISYIRNETDIGFSANVDKVVQSASGDFVLIMSDDDSLLPGTLTAVMSMLDAHPDIGVGMLAHGTYDKTMTTKTQVFTPSVCGYFNNGMDYLSKIPSFPDALISGYIVNRLRWTENFSRDFTKINSIHFIMAPLLIAKYPCFALGDKGYVKYRSDMGHWSIDTDPLYPFPMFASYLNSCKINKGLLASRVHEKMYCTTMRTVMGFIIRNKVLGYKFPRKKIFNVLAPYLDNSTRRTRIFNIMMRILMYTPMWMLYVPFRWLVPEKL